MRPADVGTLLDLAMSGGPLRAWLDGGPTPAQADALQRFWSAPVAIGLRDRLGAPHRSLRELATAVLRLADEAADEAGTDWDAFLDAVDAEAREPAAAAALTLYAMAGWLASEPDDWSSVPVRVSAALFDAGSHLAGVQLLIRCREHVEEQQRDLNEPGFVARTAGYRALSARMAARWSAEVDELAWALRDACKRPGSPLRGTLAALLWTLGDVPRAELVGADAGYTPGRRVVAELIHAAMAKVTVDPFVQYLWLTMPGAELDIREYPWLASVILERYTESQLNELDNLYPLPPSRVYATLLSNHLAGRTRDEDRAGIAEFWADFGDDLRAASPIAAHRFHCLLTLVLGDAAAWPSLAEEAAELLAAADRRAEAPRTGQTLAVASYYAGSAEMDDLERLRAGALGYALAVTPPPAPDTPALAASLDEERLLLHELRTARYITALPGIDPFTRVTLAAEAAVPYVAAPDRRFQALFEPERLAAAWTSLDELWHRMAEFEPGYARCRRSPEADLASFTIALTKPSEVTDVTRPAVARPKTIFGRTGATPPGGPSAPAIGDCPDGADPVEDLRAEADMRLAVHEESGGIDPLRRAVNALAEASALLAEGDARALPLLDHLSQMRLRLAFATDDNAMLSAALEGHDEAARWAADGPPELRFEVLNNAGMTFMHAYRRTEDLAQLRRALELWLAAGFDEIPELWQRYGDGLRELFRRTGDQATLDAMTEHYRDWGAAAPPGSGARAAALHGLSWSLQRWFDQTEDVGYLHEAAEAGRGAVEAARGGHPVALRSTTHDLAVILHRLFEHTRDEAIRTAAMRAYDEAIPMSPLASSQRAELIALRDTLRRPPLT